MMKAFRSYDLSKGFKFSTYASRLMVNEILMQFRKAEYKKKKVSLDSTISNDVEKDMSLLDLLADSSVSFEIMFEQKELVKFIMHEARTLLTEKEYFVISNILSPEPKTQTELKKDLGVSQSYISRLEATALKKIREYLESREIENNRNLIAKELKNVTSPINSQIHIEGKTLNEKIKYVLKYYPNMSTNDIANELGTTKGTVYTYISQIKKENQLDTTQEDETNLLASANKKIKEENNQVKDIARDALDKMMFLAKEKEEMLKELTQTITELEDVKKENKKLIDSLQEVSKEKEALFQQLQNKNSSIVGTNNECDEHSNSRIGRLKQLNHLLMAELLDISS